MQLSDSTYYSISALSNVILIEQLFCKKTRSWLFQFRPVHYTKFVVISVITDQKDSMA